MLTSKCPLFEKCGGCKFDFASADYYEKKQALLKDLPITGAPIWIAPGNRRRADFAFTEGVFGFYERGTKNVIPVMSCPALTPAINKILPSVAEMPWVGAGSVLITECDNGIDISVHSNVPYFIADFKKAADKSPAIRITWNGKVVKESAAPIIKFGDVSVKYPTDAFLQPTVPGENALRDLVVNAASNDLGPVVKPRDDKVKIADLFCGLGSFTYALNADGFDIMGPLTNRDLFKKPLTVQNLKKYDCVVMDPPRAGAMEQCRELARSSVPRVVYVSCNPETFMRDKALLEKGGYKLTTLIPVDQFVGSQHWELFGVFDRIDVSA